MVGKFSNYLKKKKPILKKLVGVLCAKYPYVSVLATDVSGKYVSVSKASTNVGPSEISESGYVIKVFNNSFYSEYSINEIEEKNFDDIVDQIEKLTDSKSSIENVKVEVLKEEKLEKKFFRKNIGKVYSTEE
ncbi:MAG: hypothetical protein PHX62_02340, partial [Bacilli bacterium]|nr:hypothetical protein [Bacilli bacterium]